MKATNCLDKHRNEDNSPNLEKHVVRAQLILRRTSLSAWATAHGFNRFSAHLALSKNRRGPIACRIRETLRRELGL